MALPRVLVADDSRVFRALVCELLREKKLDVSEAGTGREALDSALASRPELLILDGLMPSLSAFDVLTQMRKAAPEYRPVVFIVTAVFKSRRWESEARQTHHVEEYLEKPLEPSEILEAVARHFPDVPADA